jgi:chloride channel 7
MDRRPSRFPSQDGIRRRRNNSATSIDGHGAHGGFFQVGRDFEPRFVNHQYTEDEQERLKLVESIEYMPQTSKVYKQFIEQEPHADHVEWDRWVMMAMIGGGVGFISFFLHQLIETVHHARLTFAQTIESNPVEMWVWLTGYSSLFIIMSAAINVYVVPEAAGSGIPEVIAFLNGSVCKKFHLRTIVAKVLSCGFAVGAGIPCGPEGPMIHLGAMVGAGLSQMRSGTLGIQGSWFKRFRNPKDRRDFIAAGAGAGVAAAFGAPVGGLLFTMEEVSSFWDQRLGWQMFFCCMVATFVSALFNSAFMHGFSGFGWTGEFGEFAEHATVMFEVQAYIRLHVYMFIPALLCGVFGGVLGSIFTFCNLKISKWRARVVTHKIGKVLEPCVILMIYTICSVYIPHRLSCTQVSCETDPLFLGNGTGACWWKQHYPETTSTHVSGYACGGQGDNSHRLLANGLANGEPLTEYNEVSSLFLSSGQATIHNLFSRGTPRQYGYVSLLVMLLVYFPLACMTSGTAISSGVVIPMLMIGGLYGRLVGLMCVDFVHGTGMPIDFEDGSKNWAEPGVFALIGAASFFAGVSRLTISLTVIMVELTNDVHILLPVQTAIVVAKWIADYSTHSLYHALIEFKCIPFLDPDINSPMSMELFTAADVATSLVRKLREVESVHAIATVLLDCTHNGFPVLRSDSSAANGTFMGTVSSDVLLAILENSSPAAFVDKSVFDNPRERAEIPLVDYDTLFQMQDKANKNLEPYASLLQQFASDPKYEDLYIDIAPYTNTSAFSVPKYFSLKRTYILFRGMGLRHLIVLDVTNHVCGILTRKDLMGFRIDERLGEKIDEISQRAPSFAHMSTPATSSPSVGTVEVEMPRLSRQLAESAALKAVLSTAKTVV